MLTTFLSIILVIGAIITTAFTVLLWKRRKVPGAISSMFFMIGSSIYALAYMMEMISNDVNEMLFWIKIEYLGIAFIPAIWLFIAIQYTTNNNKVNKWLALSMLIIPIMTYIANVTNSYHNLYYSSVTLVQTEYLSYLQLGRGPFYWVHIFFFNISYVSSTVLYIIMLKRTIRTIRRQITLMLLGSLVAWIIIISFILDLTHGFDIVPFAAIIMASFFFFGLYKFKLFKLNPVVIERLVHSMEDAVIIFDHENEITIHNSIAENVFPTLKLGKKSIFLQDIVSVNNKLMSLFEGNKNAKIEYESSLDGNNKVFDASLTMIYSWGELVGKILIIIDITEKMKMISQLNEYAFTDGLTEISNRRFFQTKFNLEYARAKRYHLPLSLILIDIDHFKIVNDRFGHHAGDEVLKELVRVCKKYIKSKDVLARYGGEEFVVLIPEETSSYAFQVAESIRRDVEFNTLIHEDAKITFTASFGVAQKELDEDLSPDDLMTRADKALYEAKNEGKNAVRIYKGS